MFTKPLDYLWKTEGKKKKQQQLNKPELQTGLPEIPGHMTQNGCQLEK